MLTTDGIPNYLAAWAGVMQDHGLQVRDFVDGKTIASSSGGVKGFLFLFIL